MKKTIINLINCIVLLGIIVLCWSYCEKIFRPVYSDMSLAAIDAFHSADDNSLDVIVYGSSHSWRGVNTKELYDDYGLRAYNYSCMWQRFNTTELFLNDSFRTQNPRLVIIDVGNLSEVLKDTEMVGEVYYTRKIKDSEAKRKYLRECFGDNIGRYVTYYLPFSMYHSGWTDISEDSFSMVNLSPDNFIASRGYLGFDNCEPVNVVDGSDYWEDVLPDESEKILNNMVELCKSKGAEVLLITVPYYSNEFIYRDALHEFADNTGCTYLDFFELSGAIDLDGNTDFSEWDHLNNSGAHKITKYLGDYIKDNYDL